MISIPSSLRKDYLGESAGHFNSTIRKLLPANRSLQKVMRDRLDSFVGAVGAGPVGPWQCVAWRGTEALGPEDG